jgi:hypothetical protein
MAVPYITGISHDQALCKQQIQQQQQLVIQPVVLSHWNKTSSTCTEQSSDRIT